MEERGEGVEHAEDRPSVGLREEYVDSRYEEVCRLARAIYGLDFDCVQTRRRSYLVETSNAEPGTRMIERRTDSTYEASIVLNGSKKLEEDVVVFVGGRDEVDALEALAASLRRTAEKNAARANASLDRIMQIQRRSP